MNSKILKFLAYALVAEYVEQWFLAYSQNAVAFEVPFNPVESSYGGYFIGKTMRIAVLESVALIIQQHFLV
jgi:hypothetical protein